MTDPLAQLAAGKRHRRVTLHAVERAAERHGLQLCEGRQRALARACRRIVRSRGKHCSDGYLMNRHPNRCVQILVLFEGRELRVIWSLADRKVVTVLGPMPAKARRHG